MGDYCTRANVIEYTAVDKNDLSIDADADFNTLVDNLITRASASIDTYTQREKGFDNYDSQVETFDVGPYLQREIELYGPVQSITKVEVRGSKSGTFSTLDSSKYTYENLGMNSDKAFLVRIGFGFTETRRLAYPWAYGNYWSTASQRYRTKWWRGYENIRVTYSYGFTSVPTGIAHACIMIVDEILMGMVQRRNAKIPNMDDYRPNPTGMQVTIPENVKEALEPWRSIAYRGSYL